MTTLLRMLSALLLLLAFAPAQDHHVTVHVECGSQNMVDNEWTVDFDVQVTNPDGSTTSHHVHVDVKRSEDGASIADALANKLRKKTRLDFRTGPATNVRSNEMKGKDLILPGNVKILDVETRKRTDTPQVGDEGSKPGDQKWEETKDHVKIMDGIADLNTPGPVPATDNRRTT